MLLVLLVVVVAVRCRKLISTLSWIIAGPRCVFIMVGIRAGTAPKANQNTVGLVRRCLASSWRRLALLLALSCLDLWRAGETAILS